MHRLLEVRLTVETLQDGIVWEGWGTSLAWFAVALGGNKVLREQISTLLFSRDPSEGLGLNIVRYNIGGACQDHAAAYRTGAAVPCFRHPEGAYNWSVDDNQIAMLLSAAQHGADTFEAFVNSPPWFWTKSGTSRGHDLPLANNLQRQHIEAFAHFCGDVVEHFAAVYNVRFSSLSPFNEPGSPAWCLKAGNRQEGCYFSRHRMFEVLHALAQQPALKKHQVQLVAFEQFCLRDTLSDLGHLSPSLWDIIERINLHTYTSKQFLPSIVRPYLIWQDNSFWRHRVRKLAAKQQKNIWMSEFGSGRGAFTIAKQVIKDIVQLRPTAWVYWQAVEAPGSNWGLLEVPLESGTVTATAGSSAKASPHTEADAAAGVSRDSDAVGTAGIATNVGEVPVDGSCAPQSQQQVPVEITLHPNYFVLQFIMQCIPKGSMLYAVKQLGRWGFLVQQPAQHWVLMYLNASKFRDKTLSVNAAALVPASTGATGRARADMVENTDRISPGDSQPSSSDPQAVVNVRLLDISSLQPVAWRPGLVNISQAVGHVSMTSKGWPLIISVPKQNLCRIDLAHGDSCE